jgi:hypothetical protein
MMRMSSELMRKTRDIIMTMTAQEHDFFGKTREEKRTNENETW